MARPGTTLPGRPRRWFAAAALALAAGTIRAHDFWIEPASFTPPLNSTLAVRLRVGEHFAGDLVPRSAERIERFALKDAEGERSVAGLEGADTAGLVRIAAPGLQVLGYRSRRATIELDAAKFESYLGMEGLEWLSQLRAEVGQTASPGREVYSRCAKALLAVGAATSDVDRPFGFPLELMAEANPYALAPGQEFPVKLIFEGAPLRGALVAALQRERPDERLVARSDAAGRVMFRLPQPGVWMIKAVHMVPAPSETEADWESFWASLTFEVGMPR